MTTTMATSEVSTRPSTRSRALTWALVLLVPVATVPLLIVGDVLTGPAVMNGSARGTALVMLGVSLPVLVTGTLAAQRGSLMGRVAALGALAHLTYNAMLLVYATPFNALFLVHVALLGTALWSLVSALVDPLPRLEPPPGLPVRGIATFILVVVGLNAAAWLARIVPELGTHPPAFLAGTGLTTNPIYVQDLAVWLPALGLVGVMLARRHPLGVVLAGAGLVFWEIEAVTVAVDQWLGHRAAPASDVATTGGSVLFVVVAAVTVVPLTLWWRAVRGAAGRRGAGPSGRGG
ncbi:hypothetical protein JCM18899A_50420 [Nocardioides sp. AN3]